MIIVQHIEDSAMDIYARLNENQLRHYFEPDKTGAFIAESENVVERALDAGYEPLSLLVEDRYVETGAGELIRRISQIGEGEGREIPIYSASLDVLSRMTGYHLTRGILAAFRRKPYVSVSALCADASRVVILEDVENPTNVGAIFRSAAALSMEAVILTDGCADPLSRRSSRVSMGTVFQIPWTRFADEKQRREAEPAWPDQGIRLLRTLGFTVISMALRDDTIAIDDPLLREKEKIAVILGNEGTGLTHQTILQSDYTIRIPMREGVDSLNVAAASAVAFWELGRNRN